MPALDRIGHYRIVRTLGQGGMGVVYAAHDERLNRPVAIKMIHGPALDPQFRERLWREARAAAAVNHPNICQVYEVGEEQSELFIVMELLDGESVAQRLRRGPMPVDEAIGSCLGMLSALDALHSQGFVHRDLKPSNVFLTRHGMKLLDFGLAKPLTAVGAGPDAPTEAVLTQPGTILGTPQYMSPEQLQGKPVDWRSDVFAAGAVLFEMLAGRPAFTGKTIPELFHAIVYEPPAALTGAAAALDEILHRALAKKPEDRFPTVDVMAGELRAAPLASEPKAPARGRGPTRLIVLPFHQLRHDEETAFLCFSLPDAISTSLAGLESLVVRSSRVAARFGGPSIDLRTIAAETEVDAVMTGTLLRAGDQLRASTQLLDAPGGAVVWAHTAQVPMHDIFELQDELVRRIVESLALPLTERERSLMRRDVPASTRAYEFYLRANQLSGQMRDLTLARDLYLRSLEEDSRYAPAWARLARCCRILAKYGADPSANLARAEEAFQRAFSLNPDLPAAHSQYAHHEVEHGRAQEAIVRLLGRIKTNRHDPELYAGLVYACRYAGLLPASLAAHELARRADPNIPTSVVNTHFVMGNYQLALDVSTGGAGFVEVMALEALGRRQEALDRVLRAEGKGLPPLVGLIMGMLKAYLEDNRKQALEHIREGNLQGVDPEGFYYRAHLLARLGEIPEALRTLEDAVRKGFYCVPALLGDSYLKPVRATAGFRELLREAETLSTQAKTAFVEAGGEHLLATARAQETLGQPNQPPG